MEWQGQVDEAIDILRTGGYTAEFLTAIRAIDGELSQGIVFGHPRRLETLRLRGYLTLADSTHKTNRLGWYLYTFMVRGTARPLLPRTLRFLIIYYIQTNSRRGSRPPTSLRVTRTGMYSRRVYVV